MFIFLVPLYKMWQPIFLFTGKNTMNRYILKYLLPFKKVNVIPKRIKMRRGVWGKLHGHLPQHVGYGCCAHNYTLIN